MSIDLQNQQPKQSPKSDEMHPAEFFHHMHALVKKLEEQNPVQGPRTRKIKTYQYSLLPGQNQQIAENFDPDKWIVVCDATANSQFQVWPSSGLPALPDALTMTTNNIAKLPGITRYFSVTNSGGVTAGIQIIAVLGFDFDFVKFG